MVKHEEKKTFAIRSKLLVVFYNDKLLIAFNKTARPVQSATHARAVVVIASVAPWRSADGTTAARASFRNLHAAGLPCERVYLPSDAWPSTTHIKIDCLTDRESILRLRGLKGHSNSMPTRSEYAAQWWMVYKGAWEKQGQPLPLQLHGFLLGVGLPQGPSTVLRRAVTQLGTEVALVQRLAFEQMGNGRLPAHGRRHSIDFHFHYLIHRSIVSSLTIWRLHAHREAHTESSFRDFTNAWGIVKGGALKCREGEGGILQGTKVGTKQGRGDSCATVLSGWKDRAHRRIVDEAPRDVLRVGVGELRVEDAIEESFAM
eukprot:scaffold437_cov168-Ochromonas_danica.AAC.62